VRGRESEFMSDTSEGLCELKSTIVCCMRLQLRDDKDGLLLDLCCVCVWPYICLQLTKLTQSHSIVQPDFHNTSFINDIIQDEPHALMIVNND